MLIVAERVLAILVPMLTRMVTSGVLEITLLKLAQTLAKRTSSEVDDELVEAIAQAIGRGTPPK